MSLAIDSCESSNGPTESWILWIAMEVVAMLVFGRDTRADELLATEMARLRALLADMERILQGVTPQAMAGEEPAPVLDRWFVANRAVPCLIGLSTGHPTLVGANRSIATSDVWLMSEEKTWHGRC